MLDSIKLIRNFLTLYTKRETLYKHHELYIGSAGNYNTPTLLTLLPNTKYLLLCDAYSTNGSLVQYYSTFTARTNESTMKKFIPLSSQPYNGSGGHYTVIGFAETGNSNVEIGINSYVYAGGYTYCWSAYAIPLVYLGGI